MTNTTETATTESKFHLRPLRGSDIRPLTEIISKIGVGKFAGALQSDAVLGTFEALAKKDGLKDSDVTYAGFTAMLEIVGIIFDNYGNCEKELFSFMASVSGMTVKEVSDMPIDEFAELLGAIVKMEDFGRFFKVARGLFQ